MGMDLIYQDEQTKGSIWQSGYREIPWDLQAAAIHLVVYAASECPPLNHHLGAEKFSCPNDDNMAPPGHPIYDALLANALKGVPKVVEAVKNGKNVLITCNMGINRSSLITGLSMKELTSWPAEKIISTIQTKRPGTLTNPSFKIMLLSKNN